MEIDRSSDLLKKYPPALLEAAAHIQYLKEHGYSRCRVCKWQRFITVVAKKDGQLIRLTMQDELYDTYENIKLKWRRLEKEWEAVPLEENHLYRKYALTPKFVVELSSTLELDIQSEPYVDEREVAVAHG